MKFSPTQDYRFWWPVKVRLPDPENAGAIVEHSFEAQFLALPHDRAKQIDADYRALKTQEEKEAHEFDHIKEFMIGWRDVEDQNDNVLPFNEENLVAMLQHAWFRTGIYKGYAEAMRGEEAREKN